MDIRKTRFKMCGGVPRKRGRELDPLNTKCTATPKVRPHQNLGGQSLLSTVKLRYWTEPTPLTVTAPVIPAKSRTDRVASPETCPLHAVGKAQLTRSCTVFMVGWLQ